MEHTFLCMNVRMREDKKINIEMKDKQMEVIKYSGKEVTNAVTSPAKQSWR